MAAQLRTASVTSSWVALSALSGRNVSVKNLTGADLYLRKATESTAGFQTTLAAGESVGLSIVSNASEIQISAVGAGPTSGVNYIVE